MHKKLIDFINHHYRRYHDVVFYLLTLTIIIVAASCAVHITKQKNQQESINTQTKQVNTVEYSIEQRPIYVALQESGFPKQQIVAIVEKLNSIADTKKLQNTDTYTISTTEDGHFAMLLLHQGLTYYYVAQIGEQLIAGVSETEVKTRVRSSAGTIKDSLFQSMLKDGVSAALIIDLTDAFSWNIDFNTETRNGDKFAAVWEEHFTDDNTIIKQDLVAAFYKGEATGENYAFYYEDEFFDPTGKVNKKMFLKSPISFRGVRISSRFNPNRLHPILRIRRPHYGIDYAAPVGTPVQTVADGIITFVGNKGGFGKYIEIKHANNYVTSYGHLSRYATKAKKGAKVKQGDTIGYVGSTGLSTGPHLDFRIKDHNKFVDFLKMKNRSSALRSIPNSQREDFEEIKTLYLKTLNEALEKSSGTNILSQEKE